MQRDIGALQDKKFDMLVIGAGVHGVCVARDAALRGLSVALIDKGDICGATSHNSLKTIHGGIRYLQHLNFKRSLESINEQKYWLATAPHLVKPLPFLMPTYGYGMRGPIAMWFGIRLFELLGLGRNRKLSVESKLARGEIISKQQCLELAPNIKKDNLTGGALWYDAQVEYADKAVLQLAQDADKHGACIANYVAAKNLIIEENKVAGAVLEDQLTRQVFDVKARLVVNAAGPWAADILQQNAEQAQQPRKQQRREKASQPQGIQDLSVALTKSMNLVIRQQPSEMAIAVQSKRQSDSRVGTTKRLYFIVPWKNCAMVGTTHFPFKGKLNELAIEENEVVEFIDEINHAYPSLNLSKQDILYCYQGVTPAGDDADDDLASDNKNASRLHHSKVVDHAKQDQLEGLISLISIKWTTARLVAEKAVDLAARKLQCKQPCLTRTNAIADDHDWLDSYVGLSDEQLKHACHTQMHNSMAINLDDMLLRRSNDLVTGQLSFATLLKIVDIMSTHYGWDKSQLQQQIKSLLSAWLPDELRQQIIERFLSSK